jgi:hypothetical protein
VFEESRRAGIEETRARRPCHEQSRAFIIAALALVACSCTMHPDPPYGKESVMSLSTSRAQVWAVAPCLNLSGQRNVDPLLQADLLYEQLQQVKGLTVIPVNRTAEVYIALHLDRIQSEEQAALVCDLLGCDGLIVPTVTFYDPYEPPKVGAVLQLFTKPSSYARPQHIDPSELARESRPENISGPVTRPNFIQVVGMFDAANGTTHAELANYAAGRYDPKSPYRAREYLVSMDRYSGFVYRKLIESLMDREFARTSPVNPASPVDGTPPVSSVPGKDG